MFCKHCGVKSESSAVMCVACGRASSDVGIDAEDLITKSQKDSLGSNRSFGNSKAGVDEPKTFCRTCGGLLGANAYACMKCGVPAGVGDQHCAHCGVEHNAVADFCTSCGVSLSSTTNRNLRGRPRTAINHNTSPFDFTTQAAGNQIPRELALKWNWGAFILWFVWPFWNANIIIRLMIFGALILFFATFGLSILAFCVYLGLFGNRIAARDRSFSDVGQFIAVQSAWKTGGIITAAAGAPFVFITFILLTFSTAFFGLRQ